MREEKSGARANIFFDFVSGGPRIDSRNYLRSFSRDAFDDGRKIGFFGTVFRRFAGREDF